MWHWTICDQNVRFYLEATIIVERLFCQLSLELVVVILIFHCCLFAFVPICFIFDWSLFCLFVGSFLNFPFPDVFQSEMWCEFFAAFPDDLQPLASRVQETVLASKAEGTIRTYLAGFKRWKLWASSNCLRHMPANSFHVAAYLQCLIFEANSPSPVLNAVYSIDWAQRLAGLPKVSDHPIVSSMHMVSASQRILGKPKAKKEPITSEMLKALVTSKISDKSASLSDLRTVALCLLGYAGFFRFSELCSIRACDIKFFPTYLSIFLESSKTDQFRDGAWVAIARSNQDTCPVKALEQYIAAAKIDLGEDLPLFRALSSSRSTSKVRRQGLSYSRAREIVKSQGRRSHRCR